eukprot:jgi/Tetstr1/429878/TSEL_019743.t1
MPSADGDLPMLRLLGGLAFGTSARKEELVRSWRDDARTEALYAGHARQRRTDYDADFVAALLVGTANTGVTLVAPVKKLGKGGAPGMQLVAAGEAERRAAERAVVDNMKEADSMLIHGVRLIAEKLGPRAVIFHTDLRNAYNEAWRCTIIQRHIDCSPLHLVISTLMASLSMDSFMLMDDQSAPVRSEDNVQQGAPLLATTSFCIAIHPKVHECDSTLEASVGLDMHFDKMHAHSAATEAERRVTPADIEWPGLDGHGIPVLNVPLGSPG